MIEKYSQIYATIKTIWDCWCFDMTIRLLCAIWMKVVVHSVQYWQENILNLIRSLIISLKNCIANHLNESPLSTHENQSCFCTCLFSIISLELLHGLKEENKHTFRYICIYINRCTDYKQREKQRQQRGSNACKNRFNERNEMNKTPNTVHTV